MLYEELHTSSGDWYFNSSIAEQTNVWLDGFHAIVHEMSPIWYNFYLDQMILLQNRMTIQNCRTMVVYQEQGQGGLSNRIEENTVTTHTKQENESQKQI